MTRYVHLNPVRAKLVDRPASWRWSSYPGYAHRARRLDWVAYDELLEAWTGEFGGSDAPASYRRFVTAGLAEPPESPWTAAHQGWLLGSQAFVERIAAIVRGAPAAERRRELRRLQGVSVERVREVVCRAYGIEPGELSRRGSRHPARAAFADLARRRTAAPNQELAVLLGLSRAECVPNVTRRCEALLGTDARLRDRLRRLEARLDQAGG